MLVGYWSTTTHLTSCGSPSLPSIADVDDDDHNKIWVVTATDDFPEAAYHLIDVDEHRFNFIAGNCGTDDLIVGFIDGECGRALWNGNVEAIYTEEQDFGIRARRLVLELSSDGDPVDRGIDDISIYTREVGEAGWNRINVSADGDNYAFGYAIPGDARVYEAGNEYEVLIFSVVIGSTDAYTPNHSTPPTDNAFAFNPGGGRFVELYAVKSLIDDAILDQEAIEDIVGAMTDSNTETGIAVTYEGSDGTLNYVINFSDDDPERTSVTTTSAGTDDAVSRSDHVHRTWEFGRGVTRPASPIDGDQFQYTTTVTGLTNAYDTLGTAITSASPGDVFTYTETAILGAPADSWILIYDAPVVTPGMPEAHLAPPGKSWRSTPTPMDLEFTTDIDTTLTQEEVEDFIGGMVTGNDEFGITVTYQDSDGTLDFVTSTHNFGAFFPGSPGHLDRFTFTTDATGLASTYTSNGTAITTARQGDVFNHDAVGIPLFGIPADSWVRIYQAEVVTPGLPNSLGTAGQIMAVNADADGLEFTTDTDTTFGPIEQVEDFVGGNGHRQR